MSFIRFGLCCCRKDCRLKVNCLHFDFFRLYFTHKKRFSASLHYQHMKKKQIPLELHEYSQVNTPRSCHLQYFRPSLSLLSTSQNLHFRKSTSTSHLWQFRTAPLLICSFFYAQPVHHEPVWIPGASSRSLTWRNRTPSQSPAATVVSAGCVSGLNYFIKIKKYARAYNCSSSCACTGVRIHSSTGSFHHLFSDLCCDSKKKKS